MAPSSRRSRICFDPPSGAGHHLGRLHSSSTTTASAISCSPGRSVSARGISARTDGDVSEMEASSARHVRKAREGDHALSCPSPSSATADDRGRHRATTDVFTRFIYRPHWFVLAQTDGAELPPRLDSSLGQRASALDSAATSPRCPSTRQTATSWASLAAARSPSHPINPMPTRRRFHELAHVLLGHTAPRAIQADGETDAAEPSASAKRRR